MFLTIFEKIKELKDTEVRFKIDDSYITTLNKDEEALTNLQRAINGGELKLNILESKMKDASEAARQFALDNDLTKESIESFVQSQTAAQVSLQASNKSLMNVKTILNEYNTTVTPCGLSQEQFIAAIQQSNPALAQYLSKVQQGEASLIGYGVTLVGTTAKTIALTVASAALQAVITFGISLAIEGVISLLKYLWSLVPTIDHLEDKFDETSEAVKETQSTISNLNSELETTQQRIAELQAKDKLTLIEQKELTKLRQTNSELETEIALQKQLLKVQQDKNSENFVKAVDSRFGHIAWYTKVALMLNRVATLTPSLYSFGSEIKDKVQNSSTDSAKFSQALALYSEYQEKYENALAKGNLKEAQLWKEKQSTATSSASEYVEGLKTDLEKLGDFDYDSLSEEAKQRVDYIYETINKYTLATADKASGAYAEALDSVFSFYYNSDKYKKARAAIEGLSELTGDALKELAVNNKDVDAFIHNLQTLGVIDLNDTENGFNDLAYTIQTVIYGGADEVDVLNNKISNLKDSIDDIKNAYSTVSDAIEEFNTYGALSADTIKELISLEPEYLNLLMDENGQLNLNSESYTTLYRAKLRDLLLSQVKSTLSNILEMEEEEAEAYALAQAYDTETDSLEALIETEFKTAYASAAIKDAANNTTVYTDAVKRYATTVPSLISLVNSAQVDATKSTEIATDALEDQKDALEDLKDEWEDYKDEISDAKDEIQDLIDLVSDYIEQTKNDEKDALEERKDAFDELIDKEKEELEVKKEAAEFEKTLKEKQNTVAKNALAASIASLDDSAAGKKAQKEADDALVESRDDLYDELADHEYDTRVAALENLQDVMDDYYDAEIKKIDDYLDDERQIYNDACSLIENDTGDLYDKLWDYTYKYTTKTKAEFDHLWTSAQTALEKYNAAQYGVIEVMNTLYTEFYKCEDAIDLLDDKIDAVSDAIEDLSDKSINKLTTSISNLKSELASLESTNVTVTTTYDPQNHVYQGSNGKIYADATGLVELGNKVYGRDVQSGSQDAKKVNDWQYYFQGKKLSYRGNKAEASNYFANKIQLAMVFGHTQAEIQKAVANMTSNMYHYARGTMSAYGGLSEVNEQGHEIRVLNKGDGILTAQITKNLSNLGANPVQFLADAGKKLLENLYSNNLGIKMPAISAVNSSTSQPINFSYTINGDVNPATLRELKKYHQQTINDAVNKMMSTTLTLRNSSRVR